MKSTIDNKSDAISLLNEIKESIERDIGPMIDLYYQKSIEDGVGIGFFSVARCIFPEIDNLGSYYKGTIDKTSRNATDFLRDYFSKVNPEYKRKGAFIYQVYRHGLIHQHSPKFLIIKGINTGWAISFSSPTSPSQHLKYFRNGVQIEARQFYKDILSVIEIYKKDISEETTDELLKRMAKAHKEMLRPLEESKLLNRQYISQSDFDFLNDEK